MNQESIFKKLARYFFQGILLTVPISVTIYVVYKLLNLLDSIISLEIPGLGLLILISSITLIGYLGNTFIAQQLMSYSRNMLNKLPWLKSLYSAIKDFVAAIFGDEKKFDQPVLVKLSKEHEIEKPGFITSKDLSKIGLNDTKVAVYLPHSYAWSGNMFIVPAKNVTSIDVSATEFMKFIVSGGVTKFD